MLQLETPPAQLPQERRRRRLSLSFRVSLLLMLAAIVPLLITLAYSELSSRPTLISQANIAMQSDARTRVELIDSYLTERLLDAETLSQVPTVWSFLATPPQLETADLTIHAKYALVAGVFRDKHYSVWTLFDMKGNPRLNYPTSTPSQHGKYFVPPAELQQVLHGKTLISPVYYQPTTHKATIDIYSPIVDTAASTPLMLGFIRSTLNLDYIWNIVASDKGANGNGSDAFILDENGVRIASNNPSLLFTAVAPLSTPLESVIKDEQRYGSQDAVPVQSNSTPVNLHQNATFQMTPAGQSGSFQVAQHAVTNVPWTYFVLSPVSTVTAVANEQLLTTSIIAFAVLLLAALVGLGMGRFITSPILAAVERLRRNSGALKTLSTRQESAATEQTWVIDSSLVGLQSVQYYTNATRIAARHLHQSGLELMQNWDHYDAQSTRQILSQMINAAAYIEKAVHLQTSSSQKLATAIKVNTQVNEQLAEGASGTNATAAELEQVVNELRQVVGK
ncbi:MAG: cache domain-containing protein [Ktedonobacteraceae bacterium]